ncbi:MAG TPA: hypothetical protein VFS34_13880 [Thermoanaerobaculia bacterium]|nr:hypothetical protein [Thermoanaerobaculia bacterium]
MTGRARDDLSSRSLPDYSPGTHLLCVGAARAGRLTIAHADPQGKLSLVASVPTRIGARNPAVTDPGAVYLAHSAVGGLSDLVLVEPEK